jgi:NTE family protein
MDLETKIDLLATTPLFSSFSRRELSKAAKLFSERSYPKGTTIFREGEEGDTFCVVVSGELEVWSGGDDPELLNRLGPGEVVGELALLSEGARTATVKATRLVLLLELDRESFNRFLAKNAKVLQYFSTLLARRLAAAHRGEVQRRPNTVVAVSASRGLKGKSLVANALAAFLREYAQVELLMVRTWARSGATGQDCAALSLSDAERMPGDQIKSAVQASAGSAVLNVLVGDEISSDVVRAFDALVNKLDTTFPYIVIDLGARPASLAEYAREVADVSVEIVDRADPGEDSSAPHSPRVFRVMNLANPASKPISIKHCEPFVIPVDSGLPSEPGAAQVSYLRANPRAPASPPLRRLARKILGMTVGLAVGGGAAFGVGHVGLLNVFEDNDIPVDLIAGTSMGSIIAAGYACGISPKKMLEISARIGNKPTTLSALDFTLIGPGLLAGNRVVAIFEPFLGPIERFDQLRFPCQVVAADIETGERVSIGDGTLIDGCRASCSVPLLWVPVRQRGRVLVDGALVNPVPAEVVREMGADLCIAVNAVPAPEKGVTNALTRMWRRVNTLNPLSYLGESRHLPNTMDVFMNTLQILQHELGKFKAISADVIITPNLNEFTWVEFYKTEGLIERGAEAAEKALPQIKRLLAERRAEAVLGAHAAASPAFKELS